MKTGLFVGAVVFCLSACNKHSTDFIVSSANVPNDQVFMSIYGETQDQKTRINASLYKNHSRGYLQYLVLADGDTLNASYGDATSEFVSSVVEPLISYFDADLDAGDAGNTVTIDLLRRDDSSISADIVILSETPFIVTSDVEPISLQSTITASWEAIEDYRYAIEFAFSCDDIDGQKVGFHKYVPGRAAEEFESPFALDLGQLSPPPMNAINCGVTVSLLSEQNQSELQQPVLDNVRVYAARKQSQVIAIDNSPVE